MRFSQYKFLSLLALTAPIFWLVPTSINPIKIYEARAQSFDIQRKILKADQGLWLTQANKSRQPQTLADAERLHEQVIQLYQEGRYSEAIPLAKRVLLIREKLLNPNHPNIAASLNNLALLYDSQGDLDEAKSLYQRALPIYRKTFGPNHPEVAVSLNNLAKVYRGQGNYAQAISLFQQSLKIREQAFGPNHPEVAIALNNLASVYQEQSNYRKADSLSQKSLRIFEKALGPNHINVATSLVNLASSYQDQGNYSQAASLYKRALDIREKNLGPNHPSIANNLNNLATLYQDQNNYSQAELTYQRALKIRERALGPNHPSVATSLNNLAFLYRKQGNYTQAEKFYQKSLSIREQVLDPEHPDLAFSFNNLADLYRVQGNYTKAAPLFQKSLRIWEKVFGPEHPQVALSFNNLAELYQAQGNYTKAAPLFQKSLKIFEKVFGPEHSRVALSLNNIASLHYNQGDYAQASSLQERALRIREQTLGLGHPDIAQSLNNLALVARAQGDISRTNTLLSRAADVEEQNLNLILASGSEARKRAYMATLAGTTNGTISLHIHDSPQHATSAQLAMTSVLRRKGRVLASLTDSLQRLRQALNPAERQLLDQLQAVRSKQATLTFQNTSQQSPEQYRAAVKSLETQAENLENQLARRSVEFRTETQSVTIEAVQKQIPAGATLVELIRYQPFNPQAAQQKEKWESPNYAAYILEKQGELKWVALGEAKLIDQTASQFRQALKAESSDIKTIARQLDQQLMEPIRAKLGNTRQLLLSPDSQLNLIPFAALVDENDQYLVENYAITYLSSGRDLLKLQNTVPSKQPPLILANPDYQSPGQSPNTRTASQNRRSRDLNLTFGPLPGTQAEGTQLKKLLPKATLLSDRNATENALKQVQSPEILHIATHGFFLETDLEAAPNIDDNRASIGVVYKPPPQQSKKRSYENPLLRSGLALAGVNPRKSGTEDGIFTALEATGLNLRGTKLVVLSACETGLGDVANGEGVYGLRRAFVMAGAESQVLSLWKVDDAGTKDLMVNYYQRLKNKEGRGEALRQTQLEMLDSPEYQHPYYWAAFIPSGNWQPLR